MSQPVLVDTSAWIDALRKDGDPEVLAAVKSLTADGAAVLCDMVRLELWNGARGKAERQFLAGLDKELECFPTTAEVWQTAIDLADACRRRGITVPTTDLLIAACAEHHGLGLLHHDTHFDQISKATGKV
ncbi:MAG: PIN domain nuclease [Acidobacteria bacterium]|nr:MAG: PIN domain nuclease [Acidobacteriota bacterium]